MSTNAVCNGVSHCADDSQSMSVRRAVLDTERRWWHGIGERPRNVRLVLVTVDLARAWLSRNTKNRKEKPNYIAKYVRRMLGGRWKLNGETIVFDLNGVLANGQNRLKAIVKSGCAVWSYVIFDIDPDAFSTMDTGRPRDGGDTLSLTGEKNAEVLNAIVAVVGIWDRGDIDLTWNGSNLPDNDERVAVVEKYPEVRNAVPIARRLQKLCPKSAIGFSYFLIRRENPGQVDKFFEMLETGAGLEQGHPVLALRKRFFESSRSDKTKQGNERLPKQEAAALIIKAWNMWRLGDTKKNLVWKSTEPFPSPVQ